jgi:hypothetical protein
MELLAPSTSKLLKRTDSKAGGAGRLTCSARTVTASRQLFNFYKKCRQHVVPVGDTNSYSCGMGNCGKSGGTSFAAPRWAGFIALVNQQAEAAGKAPIGFLNSTLYAPAESSNANYATDFHDIGRGAIA